MIFPEIVICALAVRERAANTGSNKREEGFIEYAELVQDKDTFPCAKVATY
jgi:hypothetical protein